MSRAATQIVPDAVILIAVLVVVAIGLGARALAADPSPVEAGRAIVAQQCASCHAIGATGESSNAAAPPFRKLAERYPDVALTDAFEKGLLESHPAMPTFRLGREELKAILAYLHSIQEVRGA